MCTKMAYEATEMKRKKLKPTGNVGWKIVEVRSGIYYAPMQIDYVYSRNENRETDPCMYGLTRPWQDEIVTSGMFHLFSSRLIGREILNAMKSHRFGKFKHFKLVKVFYDKKDFYGVGNGVQFGGYLMDILDKHKNDSTCVKAFTFAKK